MANTKTKTEIFEELSPKYFWDVSAEAAVKFLNSQGFDITTLEEMTDNMVDILRKSSMKGSPLLLFARLNGLHNKPLPKVSPDEEKLRFDDSYQPYFTSFASEEEYKKRKLEEGVRSFEVITKKRYRFYRGINKLLDDNDLREIGIKFKFIGCDEDSYFCDVYEQVTQYTYTLSLYKDYYNTDISSSVKTLELLVEVYPDENYDRTYYDGLLNRHRYFKIVKAIDR